MPFLRRLAFAACLLLAVVDARAQPKPGAPEVDVRARPPTVLSGPRVPSTGPSAAPAVAPASAGAPAADPVVLLPQGSLADLESAWERWRKAFAVRNGAEAEAAQGALVRLRRGLSIEALGPYSVVLARASAARRQEGDETQAVQLALGATELSPHMPAAHLELARAYLFADLTEVGRAASAAWSAVRLTLSQPRYRRPFLGDVGAALLVALVATAVAVVGVLFLRRGRYFIHDFHHLFPRATARWQTAAIAVLLLGSPIVFQLGLTPALVAVAVAMAVYLSSAERVVLGVCLALLGLVPTAAGWLADATAFAGTPAESLSEVLEGGPAADLLVEKIRQRAETDRASFVELHAAGRLELTRGRPDAAVELLQKAAAKRSDQGGLLTNLGNAMLARGDTEGALAMYEQAIKAAPALAAPQFNLARVHHRRSKLVIEDARPVEVAKATSALVEAIRLDPSLTGRGDPPEAAVPLAELVVLPTVDVDEVLALTSDPERLAKVAHQVSRPLLGEWDPRVATLYPLAAAVLLFLLGFGGGALKASRPCERCGRPVCRRCDPELGVVSQMCHQCVNVFARRGVVPAPLKVRKQIEVAQHKTRTERAAYALGLVCSGAGHLFSGAPVRGAVYALLFFFGVGLAVLRNGVVRPVYGELPLGLRLSPVVVLLVAVYALSVRGLYKRQSA